MAKHSVYAASKVFGEEKFHVVLLFLSSRDKSVGYLKRETVARCYEQMERDGFQFAEPFKESREIREPHAIL